MKRYHLHYLYILLSLACMACGKNFLDPRNPDAITPEEALHDAGLTELIVNGIYNDLLGWNRNLYIATTDATDEARTNYPSEAAWQVLRGDWDATSNPMDVWGNLYASIRKANEFLSKIDGATIDDANRRRLKAEVRFLRAFQYFNLVKRYGGVPLITKPQSLTDDLQVSRNSLTECFTFITTELDAAAADLPGQAPRGKAGKGAALALKARTLLYEASPLYNEKKDASLWKQAADAAKAVMNLDQYSLYPDIKQLWQDMSANNKEPIFEVQYKMPEKYHGWDAMLSPLVIANGDAGHVSPLQELINAFPMKNGKRITDAGSGFDAANPYVGRDDRFYADIGYNGAKRKGMLGGTLTEITLLIYKGGRDYDSVASSQVYNTITGYYTLKMADQSNTIYTWGYGSVQPWLEIRYAEILLNYAEAQNEALSTPDASVYDALNTLRKRAGIQNNLVPGTLDKNAMRDLIVNERYVEFCFENQRYWDLRRWKTAVSTLNGKKGTGMVITKQPNGTFSYTTQPVDPQAAVFSEKMYFMPIPFDEISKNKKLEQNTGW
ncbi:MAG: RagB/SusD family nutrient uptake outer membrane protein [Chitinophaga sp.]|uniref:RagB/SusD family nutrient uptake outer membrane protein n=1 Tax=Chitinophaga sp. TaxID=1869181 RepID=UPI001B0A4047|nr:RagB/SusD family nutrient uptake outer membrane protein [Chitinophaga sp.]MBO9732681.1 RagB/SusD family nutrient uptake outer membrane protein [Chitinophaga sp.]